MEENNQVSSECVQTRSSGGVVFFARPNPSKFDGLGRGFDGVGVALCWHRT